MKNPSPGRRLFHRGNGAGCLSRLALSLKVLLAAGHNSAPSFPWPAPTFHTSEFALEFLVDGEEVLDLPADMREDLIHGVDLIVARVASRNGENLLIAFFGVHHVED